MMLYPSVYTLVKGERRCRYSLVLAVAKKAREIAENADRDGIFLSERPVSLAVDLLDKGQVDFIEPLHVDAPVIKEIVPSEVPVNELADQAEEE